MTTNPLGCRRCALLAQADAFRRASKRLENPLAICALEASEDEAREAAFHLPGCEDCIPKAPRCTSCGRRDHLPDLNLCDHCAQSWSYNL